MSQFTFYLAPKDPHYVPSEAQRAAALSFFRQVSPLPNATGDYICRITRNIQFVGFGEGQYAAICPSCGTTVQLFNPPNSAEPKNLWDTLVDVMIECDDEGPINLGTAQIVMPCCRSKVRVMELRFLEPVTFAKFSIGAVEPSASEFWEEENQPFGLLKLSTVEEFEKILGCELMQIWERS